MMMIFLFFFLSNICWHLLTCWTVCCKWENARRWGGNSGHTLFRHLHCCWVQCTAAGVNIWVSISDICLFVHWSVRQSVGQTVMTPFGTSLSLSLFLFSGDKLLRIFHSFFLFYSLFGFHMTQKETGGCSVADYLKLVVVVMAKFSPVFRLTGRGGGSLHCFELSFDSLWCLPPVSLSLFLLFSAN